jgi:hypothetical protein
MKHFIAGSLFTGAILGVIYLLACFIEWEWFILTWKGIRLLTVSILGMGFATYPMEEIDGTTIEE